MNWKKYGILMMVLVGFGMACSTEKGNEVKQASVQATFIKESFPFAKTITYRNQQFDVFSVDRKAATIEMHLTDSQGVLLHNFKRLAKAIEQKGRILQFATNGGIFNPDRSPTGLYIENGKTVSELDLSTKKGNFYLKPNGVFALTNQAAYILKSEVYAEKKLDARYATQSGPMLVYQDTLHPAFNEGSTNTYIRSGVGVRQDSILFFAISQQPVNFYDFAMLFKEKLACPDALYLDGAISKMYLPELNRLDSIGNFSAMISITTTN